MCRLEKTVLICLVLLIIVVSVAAAKSINKAAEDLHQKELAFQKRVDSLSAIACKISDVQTAVYVVSTNPRLCVKVDCLNPIESIAYFKYSCEEK